MSAEQAKLKVLIAAKDRQTRDQLRQLVLASGCEVAATAMDGQEAVQLAMHLRPDIALLRADLPIYDGMEAAQMLGNAAPDVWSVLLGNGLEQPDVVREAMKCGVRAYLPAELSEAQLGETLGGLAQIRRPVAIAAELPKVVVVTGGRGGLGKTTIATSLATFLAQRHPGKVVLFDLYVQFGDVATSMNVAPSKGLCEVAQAPEDIDLDLIESCMVEHETGLKVLVSSTEPERIDALSLDVTEATIHALKRAYTYIIVDMPPILHDTTLYVLSLAYRMLLVTNMFDMPTVRDCKKLYDVVVSRSYVLPEKVAIVANRVSKKHDHLSERDLERVFGRPIAAQVPNDPRLVHLLNQGVPFIKAYPRSQLVAAIEKIAREFVEEESAQE